MKTKILTKKEIPELEEGQTITIKKLNYGEKSELSDITTTIEVVNNKQNLRVSPGKTRLYTLLFGIVECPWYQKNFPDEQKLQTIREFDESVGAAILSEIKNLDSLGINGDVAKKSNTLPEEKESPTGQQTEL